MTVNLYYSTSSKSSRSARAWLVANSIAFNERDIIANPLDRDELKQILRLTENGFEDIVSTRSKAFKALHIDLSDLGFNQLLDLLVEKPQLLKRPIIYDGRRLQIGYNEEDIRAFLPRSVRKSELREIQQKLYDDDQQAVG
ncbi:Spx/MgsR family RNA polymerase-binding regulatory protein [Lactiplantibacillus mudanjiangensis]|uniref:Negative regulator of proteolysis [Lactobacillus plantarum JDM1] n=1 Tax=Lactiplantibacillus mudanjiangensis TaxID=1296538 RepID=A0A660E7H1_9LACO|nr:Spx/MgsR family RNA polymerase-binding regulatory protein [Lactiplantibacillus mudanjiangensis]VDG17860.1 negative regulator of proteolysis [Lactobacillus plantarum JDM1] [Lactiplantibacillus mudanjiangensis]VDG23306.1 negative regulator of proteolysis [Lactobacillus plantarum JDM1] [Lactiplantibacillus mudanjiangensis]VDG28266.1 negative regulator of proteolysis [Lactobacillus plantarum JDM1] [Lactiplantibacillus mudanjiangensis]VDG32442.1 negative regulator of proteolysis [Lactobacillus pl